MKYIFKPIHLLYLVGFVIFTIIFTTNYECGYIFPKPCPYEIDKTSITFGVVRTLILALIIAITMLLFARWCFTSKYIKEIYLPINLDPKLLRLKKLVDKNDSQSIILIVSNNISSEEALNEFQENIYTLSTHYIRSLGSVKGFSDNRKLIGSSKCMIEEIQDSINNIWKYRLRDKPVDKE